MADEKIDLNHGLDVNILTPDKVLFKGTVKSLSATNANGPFDILGYHTNFVSIISGSVWLNMIDNTKKEIPVGVGIVKVFENIIYIFVGIADGSPVAPGMPSAGILQSPAVVSPRVITPPSPVIGHSKDE